MSNQTQHEEPLSHVIDDAVQTKSIADVLLYLLEAKTADRLPTEDLRVGLHGRQNGDGMTLVHVGSKEPYEGPRNTDVIFGDDRLYTPDHELLLSGVHDIIGDEYEYMMEQPYGVEWIRYRHSKKAPKDRWAAGKVARWYHLEVAHIASSGKVLSAFTHWSAFSANGYEIPHAVHGFRPQRVGHRVALVLVASMREDMRRTGSVRVSLQDEVTANFVVGMGDHLDLLSERDGFYVGNRRRALVHRVCKHSREYAQGKRTPVKEHLRGARSALVGGVLVTLNPQ
jgi:hypothetical protein